MGQCGHEVTEHLWTSIWSLRSLSESGGQPPWPAMAGRGAELRGSGKVTGFTDQGKGWGGRRSRRNWGEALQGCLGQDGWQAGQAQLQAGQAQLRCDRLGAVPTPRSSRRL